MTSLAPLVTRATMPPASIQLENAERIVASLKQFLMVVFPSTNEANVAGRYLIDIMVPLTFKFWMVAPLMR